MIRDIYFSNVDSGFVDGVRDALATIKECFERYEPNQVIVAFNGGKDCIVILHLAYAYLKVTCFSDNRSNMYVHICRAISF